jgi:hypothetical protein
VVYVYVVGRILAPGSGLCSCRRTAWASGHTGIATMCMRATAACHSPPETPAQTHWACPFPKLARVDKLAAGWCTTGVRGHFSLKLPILYSILYWLISDDKKYKYKISEI